MDTRPGFSARVNALGVWLTAMRPRTPFGYLAALATVLPISLVVDLVLDSSNLANISMLYLIAVLAMAVAYGRGPAILASVAGLLTFNYFFVEPRYTLWVADPGEWLVLVVDD